MGLVQLPAKSGLDEASGLLQRIDAALDGQGLVIDASALTEVDTATVALLLHAQRNAKARAVPFTVQGAPAKLRELARLYGVEALLPLAGPPAVPAAAATPGAGA